MRHYIFFVIPIVLIVSCKKDKDDPTPAAPAPTPPAAVLPPPDAVLEISIGNGDLFGNPVDVVSASARFEANDILVNVGSVTYNNVPLVWSNQSFTYYTDNIGMSPSAHTWIVEGGNGYPAFSDTSSFAAIGTITSATTITIASGYTFTVNGATGADSLEFDLGGIIHRIAASSYSTSYSPAELGILAGEANTTGTVSAIRYRRSTREGRIVELRSKRVRVKGFTVQ